ncbi:PHD finger protein MALE MEIOCYTE DEATH like [Melia azedarach]|uniref:PHD finger protein MALE MEIOCYTE DEATH like n=1 Tax=Melia azedarach TaxID=155640 RepID=A0ACC1X5C4_MELAZ|nr:PHD finger protein MALE MEIOCYTE DEATH like [Melia azedarach]
MTQRNKPMVKDKSVNHRRFSPVIAKLDSRWSARRLQSAAEESRELGSWGAEWARMNPATRLLEYTISELGDGSGFLEPEPETFDEPLPPAAVEHGGHFYSEVVYMYENVLLNYPDSELVALATQAILDSKHFVKEWPVKDEEDQVLRFTCQVMPSFVDIQTRLTGNSTPGELVMIPLHSTVLDLKRATQIALRDTCCIMENMVVTEIDKMEEIEAGELLFGAVEYGSEIRVRGYGIDSDSKLRHEGGNDNWIVKCL